MVKGELRHGGCSCLETVAGPHHDLPGSANDKKMPAKGTTRDQPAVHRALKSAISSQCWLGVGLEKGFELLQLREYLVASLRDHFAASTGAKTVKQPDG